MFTEKDIGTLCPFCGKGRIIRYKTGRIGCSEFCWKDTRETATSKFSQELDASRIEAMANQKREQIERLHDEKTENIARAVSLNNAVNFIAEASGHWSRFADYEEAIKEIFRLADLFYNWLKKE